MQLEYILLLSVFIAIFSIPIIKCLYRRYVSLAVKVAGERIEEVQVRLTERISDAGRKMNNAIIS